MFLQALNNQIQASRKEEGIIEFAAYQSVEDPNTFVLIEVYRDVAAQEQHNSQSYSEAFANCLADCLAAPPDIKIMDGDWLSP
ncbi:MAG: antibiotic biosynthesis monooxygenase [Anaerolineae bacterium]|nr:antibiotic biosynthesis monooxygenase [Anaerolineae bacterium]